MKDYPKVMDFCYQNFTNFAPEFYQISMFFFPQLKLSIDVECLHFLTFSAKRRECKIEKRYGHGKLRNSHGQVMGKYFVKSVGTLNTYPSPTKTNTVQ